MQFPDGESSCVLYIEVAFELWIEQVYFYSFSRLQRRFPPL